MEQIVPVAHATKGRSSQHGRWPGSGALLITGAVIVLFGAAFDWLHIKTQRVFVDRGDQRAAVSQRFVKRESIITPEIVSSPGSRFSFDVDSSVPQTLLFTVVPEGECALEVTFTSHDRTRQLFSGAVTKSSSYSVPLPSGGGTLDFVSHGKVTWIDPRVVRSFFLWPLYTLAFVAVSAAALRYRHSLVLSRRGANWLTLAVSGTISLALVEILLRSVAPNLPRAILEARPDVGSTPLLKRWMSSSRYRQRLRPNLKTYSEWRFGDIVEEGVIKRSAAPGEVHRFDVQTDADGFSNPTARNKIDIAALGDSYTEGWVVPATEAWPARLEKLTRLAVQNYGVPGFGPQQELYACQDFAIKHRPRFVVLGFCAGNDLADAVSFDRWQQRSRRRSDEEPRDELVRVKMAETFRNYERLYLWSAIDAAVRSATQRQPHARALDNSEGVAAPEPARFVDGMFHIPVARRALAFAWTPPYLFELATPRPQLEQSVGWKLTREALLQLKSTCAQNGARLVLMFVPPEVEVYWPITERSLPRAELERAIDFYFSAWTELLHSNRRLSPVARLAVNLFPSFDKNQVTVDAIHANRLATNQLLAEFCASENIPMLDLTDALQEKAESGTAVYFPDDGHWNATGHEVAARELARFLQKLP